jgi:osmoprotectant transport system permease protein
MNLFEYLSQNRVEFLELTVQHLVLVGISTGIAILVGVPLGILLTRRPRLRTPVLGLANIFQTIPSLALFGFLIPLPFIGGVGARTAIVALVLYALLPIIRNTYAGIQSIDPAIREAGRGMGMTDGQLLLMVEVPLAFGVILAGIRVAMVNNTLILAGALPAALIALAADFLIGRLERRHGLRPTRLAEVRAA